VFVALMLNAILLINIVRHSLPAITSKSCIVPDSTTKSLAEACQRSTVSKVSWKQFSLGVPQSAIVDPICLIRAKFWLAS
jgi:hypothetical protein